MKQELYKHVSVVVFFLQGARGEEGFGGLQGPQGMAVCILTFIILLLLLLFFTSTILQQILKAKEVAEAI